MNKIDNCDACDGDKYTLLGCCSGRECGCMGKHVSMTNCNKCNPKGDAELPDDQDFIFIAEHVEYIGQG